MVEENDGFGSCDPEIYRNMLAPGWRALYFRLGEGKSPFEFYSKFDPICFKNRDKVVIDSSYAYPTYNFPNLRIAYCRNTTENGSWCKSDE